jgi:hypothetical protein
MSSDVRAGSHTATAKVAWARGRARHRMVAALALVALVVAAAGCYPKPPGNLYDAPSPLPERAPGTVIWAEPIALPAGTAAKALRVMYHTRDSQGRDVAATGTITYPTAPAPAGGWPILSYGHGAVGMAPGCAPSRQGATRTNFGVEGIVVAADYVGLGPNGQRHALLSGRAEGQSMIDIARAARRVLGVRAATTWLAVGVSQGGHAALFAGERADAYAPELSLAGVVAAAPTSNLTETYPADTQLVVDVVTVMGLYGMAVDHPEVEPRDYVTDRTAQVAEGVIDTGCLSEVGLALAAIPSAELFTANPRTTEPGRSVALANNPGQSPSGAPVLLVQGSADVVVVPARTEALFADMCELGEPVQRVTIAGGTHDNTTSLARPQIEAWLDARLAGTPAPTSCPAG